MTLGVSIYEASWSQSLEAANLAVTPPPPSDASPDPHDFCHDATYFGQWIIYHDNWIHLPPATSWYLIHFM